MSKPKGSYPSLERRYPTEEAIERLAPSRATVLLVGGSPQEKALVAHALHERSPRARSPFVTVDCTAVAPTLIEELLFSEPSYAPTPRSSAQSGRRGAIHEADRGTLYVADIESLPIALHPRFLRFLDDARTVRVVVSSDADLPALARAGRFREDLAERLSLVRVDLSCPAGV